MHVTSTSPRLIFPRLATALIFALTILGVAATPQRPALPGPTPPPRSPIAGPAPEHQPVLLGTTGLPNGVTATIAEIPSAADAYIASGRPDQNFGSEALFLGYDLSDGFGAERMLLRFDLSTIPANAVVQDARLRLYLINGTPASDAAMGTIVRRLASNWTQSTVTWNTEPTWASIRDESSVGVAPGWYEWNITDLTTAWVHDALANQGVEVEGDENVQQRERAFYSRETGTAFYPRLVVTYSVTDDQTPPVVSVNPLPAYSPRQFDVAWGGSDPGQSGIAHFDVQSQVDAGDWNDWQIGVTYTTAQFVGVTGHTYGFRARGVDNAGNVQAWDAVQAQTLVDTRPPVVTVDPLPAKVISSTFTVSWSHNMDASGIQYVDVRYRFNGGAWLQWQNHSLAASAMFTAMADGVYEFEARGVDNAGNVEPFGGRAESTTLRDLVAPFVLPVAWLPVVNR